MAELFTLVNYCNLPRHMYGMTFHKEYQRSRTEEHSKSRFVGPIQGPFEGVSEFNYVVDIVSTRTCWTIAEEACRSISLVISCCFGAVFVIPNLQYESWYIRSTPIMLFWVTICFIVHRNHGNDGPTCSFRMRKWTSRLPRKGQDLNGSLTATWAVGCLGMYARMVYNKY